MVAKSAKYCGMKHDHFNLPPIEHSRRFQQFSVTIMCDKSRALMKYPTRFFLTFKKLNVF